MKKNLLTLSVLIASVYSFAQDTYIGDKAIVKVQPSTLFYHGGDLKLKTSGNAAIVKNQGNIQIKKSYKDDAPTATKGEHFVNIYSSDDSYGQVIIDETTAISTGKLTMQKKSVLSNSNTSVTGASTNGIQQLPIAFPFKDKVETIMNSFSSTIAFRGNCALDTPCGQRYWMTLFRWDNNKIVNDAVVTGDNLNPGDYYLLNLIVNAGLHQEYNGTNLINYKGTPKGVVSTTTYKTKIFNLSETEFEATAYSGWKDKINKYNERYNSYLGNRSEDFTSLSFGKNIIRLGNPYTSNYDLSNVNTWLTTSLTKNIRLLKLAQNYKHSWNSNTGSSHNSVAANQYVIASYNATSNQWVGNKEAVLLRPLEMFQVTFTHGTTNTPATGQIEDITVNFTQGQKTFNYSASATVASGTPSARNSQANLYQLGISLLDNEGEIIADPVYLGGGSSLPTADNIQSSSASPILLVEEDFDGGIIANAKTKINMFNSDEYVAKPLNLELNNLEAGNQYSLRFNLKENSIFSDDVNTFSTGDSYYIHDKIANTYTPITGSTVVNFTAGEDVLDQFTFYWKDTPRNLGVGNLDKNFVTKVYKYAEDNYRIKLDASKKEANIEVYNVNGIKVSSQSNVKINNEDPTLKLPTNLSGLYVVKVVYEDGTQKNIKVLVD